MTLRLVTCDQRGQVTSSGRTKTAAGVRGSLLAIALQALAFQGEDTP